MSDVANKTKILVVENSPTDAIKLAMFIESDPGLTYVQVDSLKKAKGHLSKDHFDVVFLDLGLPDSDGLDTLITLNRLFSEVPKIVITGNDDRDTAVKAIRQGAQDYMIKGQISLPGLINSIQYAIERKKLEMVLRKVSSEALEKTQEIQEINNFLEKEIVERKRKEEENRRIIDVLMDTNDAFENNNALLEILNTNLEEKEKELKEANALLEELAMTDPLTGLKNRRYGMRVLEAEMSRANRGMQDFSIALMDLDHFKKINDTYGHDAGDAVLVEVSKRLEDTCRIYDTVVRWGGEEILIICPHVVSTQIFAAAERFRRILCEQPVDIGNDTFLDVSASVGVASTNVSNDCSIEKIISQADDGLYLAKSSGRNCTKAMDSSILPPKKPMAQQNSPASDR